MYDVLLKKLQESIILNSVFQVRVRKEFENLRDLWVLKMVLPLITDWCYGCEAGIILGNQNSKYFRIKMQFFPHFEVFLNDL